MGKKPTLGFVGLGIMGMAMAQNAHAKGYPVVVTNRTKGNRMEAGKCGLKVLLNPKEVADQSDAIVTMVTDAKAVSDVVHGKEGFFEGEIRNKTWIQMSTIDEKSTLSLAKEAKAQHLYFIDCPVAGSKKQVESAQLILLAGCEASLLAMWKAPLLSMGKAIVHAGEVGKGTALKLCMNLIVAQMTTALCESVALARVQNLDPAKIFETIGHSPALNCGYFQIKKKALLQEDYTPAFSLENMLKDVRFMDQAAKEHRVALPVTQAVRYLMEAAVTEGFGSEDLSSMAKILKPKIAQN